MNIINTKHSLPSSKGKHSKGRFGNYKLSKNVSRGLDYKEKLRILSL